VSGPDTASGLGLHVERNNGEILFAPLTPDIEDVEVWVEETLAAWGGKFPAVFFDRDAIKEVADSLEREREWLKQNPSRSLRAVTFDTSRSKPPRWAWDKWLLIGYLNLLIGNEGVGKGTLMCDLIAKLTKGTLQGSLYGEPANVAIIGDEDSFADVWVPRLVAAGVDRDTDRIVRLEKPDGGFIELKADQYRIARFVREHNIKFLFLDQLLDNLGAGTDDWKQKAVREALAPARWLAGELEIAVVGSLHPNKRGDNFRQIVAGTSAFNALSRSSLLLAQHPLQPGRVVLMRGKGNLSKAPEPLDFAIESEVFEMNGHTWNVPRVADVRAADVSIDDVLVPASKPTGRSSRRARVEKAIEEALKDGDWHPSKGITEPLEADGVSENMIASARRDLGVEWERRGMPAKTYWCLPPKG